MADNGAPRKRELRRFGRPYDEEAMDAAFDADGAIVMRNVLSDDFRRRFDRDVDSWIENHAECGVGPGQDVLYPEFHGYHTRRILGLVGKLPSGAEAVSVPEVTSWARRALAPVAAGIQLGAAEMTEIHPGEKAQFSHRDSDLWAHLPRRDAPISVTVICAITRFTAENGGTLIAPGSHRLPADQWPASDDFVPTVLDPGDALVMRADVIHCGGANTTSDERRRSLSMSYIPGWLRTYENHYLSLTPSQVSSLSPELLELLGFSAYNASGEGGGTIGLVDGHLPDVRTMATFA